MLQVRDRFDPAKVVTASQGGVRRNSVHARRRRRDNRRNLDRSHQAVVDAPTRDEGRRLTLGVLAGWPVFDADALNPFLGAVLAGFRAAAVDHDCNLLIAAGSEHLRDDAVRQAAWPFAGAGSEVAPVGHFNTDALMIVPPVRTEAARTYLNDLRSARFPVTFLGAEPGAACVAIDNRAGIFASFAHLVAHGHERIADIAGEPSDLGDTRGRLRAFRDAAREAGLEVDDRLVAYGMHTRQGGRTAAHRRDRRNRAYLELALEDAFERSKRYRRPMSVLMIDIDHFKDYNDAFGHPAGDDALVEVAKAARSVARDADVLARYGGEEFVVVMAETGHAGGHGLAERIRHAVRDLRGLRRELTVSIGVASLSPSAMGGETSRSLLERADRALYQAKRMGRDRVCTARAIGARGPGGIAAGGGEDRAEGGGDGPER